MRIGINTAGIAPGWGGAEETFLRHLIRELTKYEASTSVVVFTDDDNHTSYDSFTRFQTGRQGGLESGAKQSGIDVLLTSIYRLPGKMSCPVLPYATHARGLTGGSGIRSFLGSSPAKALKSRALDMPVLVATSKYVQQKLLQLAEIPLNKTVVAQFGVDPVFGERTESIVERPYVLTVGNTNEWKRTEWLLEAFSRVQSEVKFNLAIVGRPGDAERQSWGDRVFRIDRLPEKHLAGLYQNCNAFIRMASEDGTAATILEAMAAGAVVATPRAGAPGEVGGNAPLYYNGESMDSLVGTLRRMDVMPSDERERRAILGRQIAQEYTWERCANQVLKALRRAAERH